MLSYESVVTFYYILPVTMRKCQSIVQSVNGHPEPIQYSVAKSFIANTIDTDAFSFTVADINVDTVMNAIFLADAIAVAVVKAADDTGGSFIMVKSIFTFVGFCMHRVFICKTVCKR